MNILEGIKEILIKTRDKEHHLKVECFWGGVTVYLEYDPKKDFDEKCVIPIRYETLEEFAYIPNIEYRDKYKPEDYGLYLKEIILIKEVMEYLESHSTQINELCAGYSWEEREIEDEERNNVSEKIVGCEGQYRND